MTDELDRKPRRRIVFIAKIEADDWDRLKAELRHLETEIAMHGKLPPSSVSGGYSCGHIVVTSEDGSIDHDSWAREIDAWVAALPKANVSLPPRSGGEGSRVGGASASPAVEAPPPPTPPHTREDARGGGEP
jgi:hypothetical protein